MIVWIYQNRYNVVTLAQSAKHVKRNEYSNCYRIIYVTSLYENRLFSL